MSTSKLMKVTYYDPKSQIRLLCYADTVVWDTKPTPTLTALRFGGYPERVQGLADAIYGGATIEIEDGKDTYSLKTLTRQYRRELSHDGVYAEATLIAEDDGQSAKQNAGDKDEPDKDKNDEDDDQIQQDLPPRNTYIFCTPGERRELFDAVDQKTAVPMIPEYQDYVLTELQKRNTAVETALPPDPFIDQFPGKDDRGIAGQEIEELELQSCKGELTSAHCDPLAQGVHHQIFINDTARRCGLRRVFIGRRTAKQGTDSGRALLGTVFRKAHIKPSVHKSRPNIRFTDWEHK